MKQWIWRALLFCIAVGALGFLVAASGMIPLKASAGHWAITEWLLQFGMRRSIATHSLAIKAPANLGDTAMVLRGAGHYETGCRSCHGAPGTPPPRIGQAMLPSAPELGLRIHELTPEKLFYVVKHGLKFTGMPAWPAQERDDEVWAMVAFLLKLPEISGDEYRRLVHGEPAAVPPMQTMPGGTLASRPAFAAAQACARCHGIEGEGRGDGAFPRLAGQRREYLKNALHAYAQGARHSGIMEPAAAALTTELIDQLASHYAELETRGDVRPEGAKFDALELERGRRIAEEGVASRRIPACVECHGPKGTRMKPAYPSLAGMSSAYLIQQMELFKAGKRGGSAYAKVMREVAERLNADERRAAARYFETLPPRQESDADHGAAR
jgi:cytochrome c553